MEMMTPIYRTEAQDTGNRIFWSTAGFVYAAVMVYWPLIQEIIPNEFGIVRVFDIYVSFLFFAAIIQSLSLGEFHFRPFNVLIGLYLIVAARFLSLLFSPHLSEELLWSAFRYVEALVLVLVFTALKDTSFIRGFVVSAVLITVVETIKGGAQVLLSGGKMAGTGFSSGRGIYEMQIFLALWGILAIGKKEGIPLKNLVKIILGIAGVVITVIRTAFIQLIISFLSAYFLSDKERRRRSGMIILLSGIFSLLVVGFVYLNWPLLFDRAQQVKTFSGSLKVRLILWKSLFSAFSANPLTGIGSGAFGRYQQVYLDRAMLSFVERENDIGLSAHNTLLGFLGETGIIGVIAFLVYALGTAKAAKKLSHGSPAAFNVALSGTVISGLLLDLIAGSSFQPITASLVALMCAAYEKAEIGEMGPPPC